MGLSLHISIVPLIMMVVSLQVISLPLRCLEEERAALLQLKDSLNYPNGTSLPSWRKGDARCCGWDGVWCSSGTGRVTRLDLWGVRNGELGDWYLNASLFLPFQELITLNLMDNQIAGWVENKGVYQPFKMSNLEELYLSFNRLDNSILSYVDGLSSLKTLDISYNRLKGSIDLKECPSNLETLYLSGKNITKVVASGGPTNLSALYLYDITAYGSSFQTLLQSLGALPNLTTLGLGNNDLRGRVLGDDLRNLSSLEELHLDGCSLDENSIQSLEVLSSLKNLSLQVLRGVVPFQGFFNLKNLELLDLSSSTLNSSNIFIIIQLLDLTDNQIAGWVENKGVSQPFKMSKLEYLSLGYNRLDNSILSYMDGLSSLKTLDISYNRLEGLIDLKECPSNLETLYLSCKNITKVVASGGPTNLSALYLSNITTYGSSFQTLLQSLGALPNLTTLGLGDNDLRGRVLGDDLRNLSSLEELYLDSCSLDENSLRSC